MDLFKELEIGDRIEVIPTRLRQKKTSQPIVSQIVDMHNNKLTISGPIRQGISYQLHLGQQINIIIYHQKGVFSFAGEVEKKIDARLPQYIINPLGLPIRIQRRLYFRLEILTKVLIRNLNKTMQLSGHTKDISGGGMKLVTKNYLEPKQKVECIISLDDNDVVTILGEIVRVERNFETNEYEMVIEFVDVTDNNTNKIVAFIFKKQLELRQKGLM